MIRTIAMSITLVSGLIVAGGRGSQALEPPLAAHDLAPMAEEWNPSIERMQENSGGVLDINASLLVAYVDQIERHRIKQLTLVDADQAALECLPRLKGLDTLRLEPKLGARYAPALSPWTDFSPVGRVTTLKSLTFRSRANSDLIALQESKGLERLELNDCSELSDLRPLAELTQLTTLTIRLFKGDSLDPLAQLKNLTDLKLQSCAEIHDLSPLAGLKTLKSIELGCPRISDLRPLRELQGLTSVSFSGYAPDLSPLASTPIKVLRLDLGPSAEVQGLEPLGTLPNVTNFNYECAREKEHRAIFSQIRRNAAESLRKKKEAEEAAP